VDRLVGLRLYQLGQITIRRAGNDPSRRKRRRWIAQAAMLGWTVEGLFVKCVGRGPRVVLLHGGVLAGELCWRRQLPLADHFRLEIADRAG